MPDQVTLYASIAVGVAGSAVLALVASMALSRRRTLSYFLITVAMVTLTLRSLLGGVTLGGYVPTHTHHVLEHLLDALIVGLLFAAIYAVRGIRPQRKPDVG